MKNLKLFVLILLYVTATVDAKAFYTITLPGQFTTGNYYISMATQNLNVPMKVKLTVFSTKFSKSFLKTVDPEKPTNVAIQFFDDMPKNESYYDYSIRVEGLSGIIFKEEASLGFNAARSSVMVQTDKGIYKPGDKVRFRVIFTNSVTRAIIQVPATIYVVDSKNNRVKEWKTFDLEKTYGVFSGDLKLSSQPLLGNWNIFVQYDDNELTSVPFEVAEYVLPKFKVTVSTSSFSSFKKGKVVVVIDAKYTYGKIVKGSVTVQVENPMYYQLLYNPRKGVQPTPQFIRKIVPINGRAVVTFDIKKDLLLTDSTNMRYLNFQATVTEELTGIALSDATFVPIYNYDYIINISNMGNKFKPGLPYKFEVTVSRPDGKPYIPKRTQLKVTTFYGFDNSTGTDIMYKFNKNGKIFVSRTAPLSAILMDFKFEFKMAKASLYLSPEKSSSNSFIQGSLVTKKLKRNQQNIVRVVSTKKLQTLLCVVKLKSRVTFSRKFKILNKKSAIIKFSADRDWAPNAKMLISYYTNSGEIVSDVVDLVMDELSGSIDVQFSKSEVKPGESVDLLIKPDYYAQASYVGLAAVDQSVLLLNAGNTITKDKIESNLQKYYTYGGYPNRPEITDRPYSLTYYPAYSRLIDAGTIVFTNAETYQLERSDYNYYGNYGPSGPGGVVGASGILRKTARLPMGIESDASNGGGVPAMQIRKDFPETWIWEELFASYSPSSNATPVLTRKVPDTITSWVLTAFSTNIFTGLGVMDTPATLNAFKPFFVSLTLPYSIVRGEELEMSVQVFNYLSTSTSVRVTLYNEKDEFDFKHGQYESSYVDVDVEGNSGVTVPFTIIAKKIGYITLLIKAVSPRAGDGIEQQLLVKPEGTPVFVNKAVFLDLRSDESFIENIEIILPDVAIPDYKLVEVSVFGNLLGDTDTNLNQLIRLPSGCGEQTIAAFVPIIVVLDYLTAVNKLTPEVESRAKSYLEIGYQTELTYQRFDGSFSCFGQSDASGSTWLTAFVVKSFYEAKKYILIDDNVLSNALNWLINQQSKNGRFPEVGRVSHMDAQGDTSGGAALTAYVVIALLTARSSLDTYKDQIDRATQYIANNAATSDELYTLAISAYALKLADHPSANSVFDRFDAKAMVKDGFKWWEKPIPSNLEKNRWYYFTNSIDIEITAYGLLTYLAMGKDTEAFPIVRWLIGQRNSLGGFQSTQDTVLSIQGLAKFAEVTISDISQNIDVAVRWNEGGEYKLSVNAENPFPLSNYELGSETTFVQFDCTGKGLAIGQVSYRYNVLVPEPEPRFNLDINVDATSTVSFLNVTICTSFIPFDNVTSSNMVVVEIPFPSGYTFNSERLQPLKITNNVKRVDLQNADTLVILYFDFLDASEVCMAVDATKTTNVALTKPVAVKVYDYYDNSRRARKFYSAVE